MAQYLPLPDGSYIKLREGETPAAAWMRAQQQYPEAFGATPAAAGPKESTLLGEAVRGAKQLGSATRTGIGALTAPEEAAIAGVERSQQIAEEAGAGPSFAALRKVYEEQGLLPAVGELASQVPRALAGQAAQLAALAGGAKAGAMAGTAAAPLLGPAAPIAPVVGGVLGAGATLLPQFFGANVERQAAEQMARGEPVDIDRAKAAAAAAGQAGIEATGTAFVLGKRVVKGVLGITDDAALATAKAREELVKAASRSTLGAAGRGAAVGLAEVPVEVAQAVIERAQAGLDVLSPEALSEYGENAYLAGLVGPTLGAATRVTEPGAAREKLAAEDRIKAAEEKRAARAVEAAEKAKPEYALKLETDYQAAVARMKELQAAVPKKPGKDALPEERMAYEEAKAARDKHLKEVLQPLAAEYVPRKAEIAQLKERQRVEGLTPLEYQLEQTKTAPIKGIRPGKAPVPVEDTEIFPTIRPTAPALAYAQQRIQLANEQAFADSAALKEQADIYAQYLLQNPTIARQLVAAKPNIPDLTAKQNTAVYKKLDDLLKQQVQQQTAEIEAEGLKAREFTYEEQALEDARRLREEEAFADEERMREEEAMAVEPFRKEEAVIDTAAEQRAQAQATTRKAYLDAIDAYQAARGTSEAPAALQRLLDARRAYEGAAGGRPIGTETLPPSPISEETEAQLDRALTEIAGEAPVTPEVLEQRIETLADARKRGIARVSENASELAQYDRLTRYMGTPQGLTQIARTPEMAEAAERRKTPLLERAQQARNEAIAAAIQEIRLQRDLSGLVPLDKTDAELQTEFATKLQAALTSMQKGKGRVNEEQRQRAIADQLQRVNSRIQALEGGDRAGRLLGYASAFRTAPERKGELNNLYKAYRNLITQQGLTPQAAQLNRTLQNLVDFYTIGGGAAKPRITAAGPRQARRELVLGERTFTGYEPTVEGTEVRYDKPRKIAEYRATPEDQALVEQMRTRELAELNEAADRQYTPETSERVKQQIFDELRQRLDALERPATQEEVARARAEAPAVDEDTGDLFAAATERAKEEFQTAVTRRTAARSELGRALAGMRGKSAIMDQAQRLAEKFGKDLGLQGTYAEARKRLTAAQRARLAAETEAEARGQEALLALADDAKMAQQDAEAISRSARNTVEAIATRLEAEKETPTVEVRTPPRAVEILRKIVALQALIGQKQTAVVTGDKVGTTFAPVVDVGSVKQALDQATRAAKEGETWASRIEQVQAHMATLEKYLSRREAQGRLLPEAELMAKQWYRKLAEHEAALRRPTYGAGQLTPAEIRKYTQYRLELAQTEYDRIKTQIDGLHRQLLDTEVAVAKREADRITAQLNALTKRIERREGADLAEQEMSVLVQQHKEALQRLEEAKKVFEERKKAESVPFTRKSPVSALAQWTKDAEARFEQSVQRFKDKQKALELQFATPETRTGEAPVTTAAQRRAEIEQEKAATAREATGAFMPVPQTLQDQLEGALKAQSKLKKRGSKKQRAAIAQRIQEIRSQLSGLGRYGQEYYDTTVAEFEAQDEAEAREAGKEETTRAGRRKAAKEIFGVQRTIAETGEVPQAAKDGNKLDNIIKNNRQAFEMAVAQGFKSTAIRPQKRGKSATPERLMRTPLEGIAYRMRQEIVEKMAAPQTKKQKQELNKLRNELYGLEEAINTPPVTVEERRRTARAVWAKLPKDMRNQVVDTFKGRTESGGVSTDFFDRFADALETTVIRERLGQPLSQAPVTIATAKELAPIQAETEKRVAATLKATEALRNKYYEQKEKELADKARLKGAIDAATQKQIEKEANEFADKVIERMKEEEARTATQRMTEPLRRKPKTNVPGEISPQFSRGPTANPSTADSLRTELKQTFPDLGRVQIYDSVDALVAANPQYEGQIPSDARGFVDTAGNKAFLIAENINQGQALSVLLHEVGAHIGLKNALGETQYNTLVNAVKSWEKKADGSTEAKVAQAARARVEAAETKASQVNDELLAYAIEEAVNAGVKPTETKGVLGQWLSRVAALFRKALEKFGLPPKALDAQGIVDMAFGAAKMEMQPAVPQVSRRQFLRGAGAALGTMKLPPLSKDMQLDALEVAWEASMDAARTWFNTAEAAAKTPTLKAIVGANNIFDIDNEAVAETLYEQGLEDLYNHLHYEAYGPMGTEEEFRANLRSYLEDKGVNAVAELQQALKSMYQNVLKEVKGTQKPEVGELFFSKNLPTASRVANQIVGEQKGWFQKIKDNLLGVGGRMQFVDMRYTLEEALKRGGVAEDKALQAMYYVRAYDQRMHMVSQAYQSGAPVKREITRRDGEKEYIIESAPGANISEAARILTSKPVVKAAGSADAANKLVTLYMSAIRGENVGFDKLNFGRTWAQTEIQRLDTELKKPTLEATERTNLQKRKARLEERLDTLPTEQDILAAKAEIEADPVLKDAFDKVREIYNEYNRNLIEFAVQSGAISREEANKLLKNDDYIPYYRMRGGAAELVIGNETPIRIGNLKDNPDLRELLGGDEPIVDFLTSSMQNTAMLLDMSMRNLATKNAMFELRDVGLARVTKAPKGGAPANTITFKRDGEEYYAVVDTDALGIDSELVVKSMAGIPTLVPGFIRAMGIPARFLRRLIVASPVYWAKSLFRDTTAATLTSGANIVPLFGALRQIGKTETLERRGVTGGQVFSGLPEDTQRILKEMQAGKISLTNGMAWFEAKSAQIDAITRQNQYNSYIQQGLSELEATMMAMESMNFSRRGLSPAVHWLNTMIPFFNSQIQGLDVLYRSFTGKMPLNEKLGIKRKLWLRGSMIFGMSMAYAALMQDDEAYKNASPEEKYGNWFVRLPGVKEPLRLPIPFELGYVFKALPEALVNIMVNEKGGEEAFKALKHFATQMIPGASNYFLPQAIKPALEAAANYSIYTKRDIESDQEQEREPWRRYRDATTEVAKDLGKLTNFSPVMMEYLVRGYTGSLGMALLQALSFTYPKGEVEKAPKRLSEMPVIGALFQPNDARGIIDATFKRMKEIESAQKTYNDILKEGNLAEATAYAKRKAEELSLTSVAGNFREMMGELTAQDKEIRAARGLSGDQKRKLLDQIRQQQIRIATSARQIFDRSTRQAVLA